jgi:hypothetical protein
VTPDTAHVIRVGAHVSVTGGKHGIQHPHAGKQGVISEILRLPLETPRVVIALDDRSGYIVVTLPHIQVIP